MAKGGPGEETRRDFVKGAAVAGAAVAAGALAAASEASAQRRDLRLTPRTGSDVAGEEADQGGTLIRGPDGRLYLIPDGKLEAFALTDDQMAKAREILGNGGMTTIVGSLRGPIVHRLQEAAIAAVSASVGVPFVDIGAVRKVR